MKNKIVSHASPRRRRRNLSSLLRFILLLLAANACSHKRDKNPADIDGPAIDTAFKHDTIYVNNEQNWQQGFGLTHDPAVDSIWFKPVNYYIQDVNCSPIAKDFYRGEFKPGDNETTAALLDLALTDNDKLRPFYRWCLNKTIQIQDGALAEYTGEPARKYAEKFPKEFFQYMDIDSTGEKYNDWVESIYYSGNGDSIQMIKMMKQHCKGCSADVVKRIRKFAADCAGKNN